MQISDWFKFRKGQRYHTAACSQKREVSINFVNIYSLVNDVWKNLENLLFYMI